MLIGNNSINSIIEHLKPTLCKLNVDGTLVDGAKLSELKVMPRLKILNCQHLRYREVRSLQKQLPGVHIVTLEERANSRKNNIFNRFDNFVTNLDYRYNCRT